MEGSVAERLGRRTSNNLVVPGSSPILAASWSCFSGAPKFNSSVVLVKSQLVYLLPAGILNHVMLYLKYSFLVILPYIRVEETKRSKLIAVFLII